MPKTSIDTIALADALRPALLQVGRELRREARAAGVSPEQVSLLVDIKYAPGIGLRELAARERVSPPAMTKHVDRLERDGLVERTAERGRPPARRAHPDGRRASGCCAASARAAPPGSRSAWTSSTTTELAAIEAAVEPLTHLLREDERR